MLEFFHTRHGMATYHISHGAMITVVGYLHNSREIAGVTLATAL